MLVSVCWEECFQVYSGSLSLILHISRAELLKDNCIPWLLAFPLLSKVIDEAPNPYLTSSDYFLSHLFCYFPLFCHLLLTPANAPHPTSREVVQLATLRLSRRISPFKRSIASISSADFLDSNTWIIYWLTRVEILSGMLLESCLLQGMEYNENESQFGE